MQIQKYQENDRLEEIIPNDITGANPTFDDDIDDIIALKTLDDYIEIPNLIIVDIETTGLNRLKSGVCSIGAVDFNSEKSFYAECRISRKCTIDDMAIKINGFTLDSIYDESKPTEEVAYKMFEEWALSIYKNPILGGENIGNFDALFLNRLYEQANNQDVSFLMNWPFRHRFLDLHSIVFFLTGKSMSLKNSCEYFSIKTEEIIHNALAGAEKCKEVLKHIYGNCREL